MKVDPDPVTVHNGEVRNLAIKCAGLNVHSQVQEGSTADVPKFISLSLPPGCEDVDVLFASWSTTVLADHNSLWTLGYQKLANGDGFLSGTALGDGAAAGNRIANAFGDHNGLVGFLDAQGVLNVVGVVDDQDPREARAPRLAVMTDDSSPRLGLVAMAGNDRIAVAFQQALGSRLCHVAEFVDLKKFFRWYRDPSGEANYPDQHHMLPGRPKQLLANSATFLLLMEDGQVYTWGDARHRSLARPIVGEGASPADKPGIVDALGGLNIIKVACSGWMGSALSQDGALYLWGTGTPGTDSTIKCLEEVDAGQVVLAEIPDADGEPLDVVDVAVGDAHVVAITANGGSQRLWVVGENRNGQLGIDSDEDFIADWTEARNISGVQRVVCGPKSTFAFVRKPDQEQHRDPARHSVHHSQEAE